MKYSVILVLPLLVGFTYKPEFCSPKERVEMVRYLNDYSGEKILDTATKFGVKDIEGLAQCFYENNKRFYNYACDNNTTTLIAKSKVKKHFDKCLNRFGLTS